MIDQHLTRMEQLLTRLPVSTADFDPPDSTDTKAFLKAPWKSFRDALLEIVRVPGTTTLFTSRKLSYQQQDRLGQVLGDIRIHITSVRSALSLVAGERGIRWEHYLSSDEEKIRITVPELRGMHRKDTDPMIPEYIVIAHTVLDCIHQIYRLIKQHLSALDVDYLHDEGLAECSIAHWAVTMVDRAREEAGCIAPNEAWRRFMGWQLDGFPKSVSCHNLVLARTNLEHLILSGDDRGDSTNVHLRGISLEEAVFGRGDWQQIDMRGANLAYAKAGRLVLGAGIDLRNAMAIRADMREAVLEGSRQNPVDLRGGEWSGSNFNRSYWNGVDAEGCTFDNADFRDANLEPEEDSVDLSHANLTNVNGDGLNLNGAKLHETNLKGIRGKVKGIPTL